MNTPDTGVDIVRASSWPNVDPTCEMVFEDGAVTFRNFRGTKCRLRIGQEKGEIATLGTTSGYRSGGDLVFVDVRGRGLVSTRFTGWDFDELARVARAHGIEVDDSLFTSKPLHVRRGTSRRLWNMRPKPGNYFNGGGWLSGLVAFVALYWSPLFALVAGVGTFALVALKLGFDRWRFVRYANEHGIPVEPDPV